MITTIIFITLAGVFKAIADTLQHHYYTSVFKNLNERWWNPAVSWKYVKFIPWTKYRPDAWHLANSGMIVCFCLAVAGISLKLLLLGAAFILAFNLFYNKLLIKKS